MFVGRLIRLDSLAIILSAGILIGCGPSATLTVRDLVRAINENVVRPITPDTPKAIPIPPTKTPAPPTDTSTLTPTQTFTNTPSPTVTSAPMASCLPPPAGLISWWPGEGNGLDVIGPNDPTELSAAFAPGMVGQAFSFDAVNDVVGRFSATGIGGTAELTIELWVKHNSLPNRIEQYVRLEPSTIAVLRHNGQGGQLHFFMTHGGQLRHTQLNGALQAGVFHHVAGTYDGSIMRLYLDGQERRNLAIVGTVDVAQSIFISNSQQESLDGLLDEITIYNRALTAAEIQEIFNAGSAGKCGG